jgi:hypothetical protein
VAAIGDYQRIRPPKKTVKGIVKYLAWRLKVAKVRPGGTATLLSSGGASQRTPKGKRVKVPRVFQHGLTNYTSCAGQYLNARIPKIQRQVKRKMRGAGKPPEPQPPEPPDDDGKPQVR